MLQKLNRLTKKKDFESVFKNGASFKSFPMILRIARNGLKRSRFAFVISVKVSKKAVERNKTRRLASEAIRLNLGKIKGGFDAIFIVLPGAKILDYMSAEKNIISLLIKAKAAANHKNV